MPPPISPVSPDEYVPEGVLASGTSEYIPTLTEYNPLRLNRKPDVCYDDIGADPRLAFRGPPSNGARSAIGEILGKIRKRVITNGKRRVVVNFPNNCVGLMKKEEAVLPDGTKYTLKTMWITDPDQ